MELKIEAMGALCELQEFIINGIQAEYEDFGEKYDSDPDSAEDYSCGDMEFFPKFATTEILGKYKINNKEYNEICEGLDVLSFGCCGWCS